MYVPFFPNPLKSSVKQNQRGASFFAGPFPLGCSCFPGFSASESLFRMPRNSSESVVEPNKFEKGSIWSHEENATAFIQTQLPFKNSHTVSVGDKGVFELRCCGVDREMTAAEMNEKCAFIVRCKKVEGNRVLRIVRVCMNHTCCPPGAIPETRQRSISTKLLHKTPELAGIMDLVANDAKNGLGKRKRTTAKALKEEVFVQTSIELSLRAAHKFYQEKSGGTFEDYLEDMIFKLKRAVDACKIADPEGLYEIELEPRLYSIKGCEDSFPSNRADQFLRLHVMPSAAKHFWAHSRKILSVDAAHLKGQLDCVVNMLTTKDANDQNLTLMYSICPTENEQNWQATLSRAAEQFGHDIKGIISDRDKGLLAVERTMEDKLKDCIFMACAVHLARNAKLSKDEAVTAITKMANAPTEEKCDEYLGELREHAPRAFLRNVVFSFY